MLSIVTTVNIRVIIMTSLKETPNVQGAGNALVSGAGGRVLGGVTVPPSGFHSRASYVLVAEVSELPPPLEHPHSDQGGYLVLESDLRWNPSLASAHCAPKLRKFSDQSVNQNHMHIHRL